MNTLNFALILIILCEPGWTGAVFHRKFVGYTSNCKCIPDNFPCAKKGFRVRFNFGRTPSSCLPGLILCCDEGTWKRAASDDVLSFDFLQKSSLLENEQENLFTYYEDNGDFDEIEDSLDSNHQDYRDNSDSTKNNPKERNIPILFSTKIGETDENDDNYASNQLNGDLNIISTGTSIKSPSNVQMLLPETSDISNVDENMNSEYHHVDNKPLESVPEMNLVQSTSEFDKSHSDSDMISNNTTEPFDNVPGLETRLSSSSNMSSAPLHSSNEWQSESKPVLKADVAVTGELNVSSYPSNISQPLQYQQTTLSEPLQIPSSEYLDTSSISEESAEEFGSLNNKINITVAELEANDSHFDENVIKNTSIGNELTLDQPVTDGVLVVDEMTLKKDVKNGTIDGEVNVVIPKVDEPVTDRSLIEDQMTLKKDVKNDTLASKVHVMLPKVDDPVANHILIENEMDLTTGVEGTTTDEVKSTNYKYTTEITTSSNDFTISTLIPDDIEGSSLLETEVPSTEEPENPILIDPETEVTTSSETSTPIYNYLEISTTNDDLGRSTLDESWYEVTTISPIEDNLEPSSSMDENYSLTTTTNPPNMGEETSAYGTSTDNYIDASVRDPVNNNTSVSKVNTINTEQNQTKVDSKLLQGSEESNMAVPSNDRLLQDRVVCDSKLLSDSKCTLENYGSAPNIINTPFNEDKTASKGVTYKMVDEPFNVSSTQDNDIEINSSVSSPNMVLNSGTNSRLPRENQASTTENPGLTQRPNFKRLEELPLSPQPTNGSQISRTETLLTPTTTRKETGPQTPIANETDTTDVDLSTFSIPLDIEAKSSQDEIADYLGDELVIITDSKVTLEPIHINSEEDEEGKEKEKGKSWKENSKFLKWVYNIFN